MAVWGPVFLLGMFGLSEFLGKLYAFYVFQIFSNFFIFALLWDFYLMFGLYVQDTSRQNYSIMAGTAFAAAWIGGG